MSDWVVSALGLEPNLLNSHWEFFLSHPDASHPKFKITFPKRSFISFVQ